MTDYRRIPRTTAESYTLATGSSSLRDVKYRNGPTLLLGAAGMSPYQMGVALLRLRAEWDGAAKPIQPTRYNIERLADSLDTVKTGQHKGMVEERNGDRVRYSRPVEVARRISDGWHLHELSLLFQRLKTLPEVRLELEGWIGGPHAERLVGTVLAWWLHPVCHTCRGSGKRIIKNTGGRSTGERCPACISSKIPGQPPLPHGGLGRKLLSHINACCGTAAKDVQRGKNDRHSAESLHQRNEAKKHRKIARLLQADAEARIDALTARPI